MKGKGLSRIAFVLGLFFLVGCNQETNNEAENPPSVEESEKIAEEVEKDEAKPKKAVQQSDSSEEDKKEINKSNSDEKSNQVLGDDTVFIGGTMVETEDKIVINGESNLLPGSRVVGEVSVDDEKFFADTTEIVDDNGTFLMEIDHHDLAETTRVTLKFHFDGQQDDKIKRNYGDRGQKLKGNYIYTHKGKVGGGDPQNIYKMAKAEVTFDPGEEKAIREFTEPSWYPVPENIGDPRVWIEIDEIKNR